MVHAISGKKKNFFPSFPLTFLSLCAYTECFSFNKKLCPCSEQLVKDQVSSHGHRLGDFLLQLISELTSHHNLEKGPRMFSLFPCLILISRITFSLLQEKYRTFQSGLPATVAETLLRTDPQIELPLWLVHMFKVILLISL